MANQDVIPQTLYILGDGVSLTASINLKTTPILQYLGTTLNYNTTPTSVAIIAASDALGNSIISQVSVSLSGSKLVYTFVSPFSDLRCFIIQLLYNV